MSTIEGNLKAFNVQFEDRLGSQGLLKAADQEREKVRALCVQETGELPDKHEETRWAFLAIAVIQCLTQENILVLARHDQIARSIDPALFETTIQQRDRFIVSGIEKEINAQKTRSIK